MRLACIIGCVLQQGKQITTEVSDLPKVTGGDHNTAGMLNQALIANTACTQPACLSPAPLVVVADQRMEGGKESDLGLFFSSKRKPIIFLKDSLHLL